jgi:uncharacterized protein YciI
MKIILIILLSFLIFNISKSEENKNFDSTLAKKLGADKYGMKKYVFVLLTSGTSNSNNKKHKDSCFAGHMKNIDRLVKEGKLILAGPFMKNDKNYRGLFILNCKMTEAEEILNTDTAIANNYLKAEMTEWYGSAALSEYLEVSDKIWKEQP